MCTICGKTNHNTPDYRTTRSEFAGHDNQPYVGSESHTKLVKAFGSRDSIPNYHDLQKLKKKKDGSSKSSEKPLSTFPPKSQNKKDWKNKGLSLSTYYQVDNGGKFVELEVDAVPSDLQSWSRGICRERSCIRRTQEGYASRVQGDRKSVV